LKYCAIWALAVACSAAMPTGHWFEREGASMSIRRRIAAGALALALGSAGAIAAAVPASADAGGNAALQFCRSIAQYFPGTSEGNPQHDGRPAASS
jgi:hypothetical protein